MSKNNGKVYYAVGRGREIGIYDTWQECKAQVEGFNQAKFRKFFSLEEANEFVNFWKNYTLTQPSKSFVSNHSNYKDRAANKSLEKNCCWTIETNAKKIYSPPKLYKIKNCYVLGCEKTKSENYETNTLNTYKFPYNSPIKSFCKTRLCRMSGSEKIKKKQKNSIKKTIFTHKNNSNCNFVVNKSIKEVLVTSPQKSYEYLHDEIKSLSSSLNVSEKSNKNENKTLDTDSVKSFSVETQKLVDNKLSDIQTLCNKNDIDVNKKLLSQITKQLCDSIGLLNLATKFISKDDSLSLENIEKSLKVWIKNLNTNGYVNLQIDCEENTSYNVDSLRKQQIEECQTQISPDVSFSQTVQSSSVIDNLNISSSILQTSDSKLETKNIDVLALSLRFDSFEKRFDACLKEIGAISSQISQIKSEIKEIKEQANIKPDSWNNSSPRQKLIQTTLNLNDKSKETRKLCNVKRKLSTIDSTNSKRCNMDTDFFDICNIKMETVDYTSFTVDADDYVHVYTDGACHSNGQKNAKAGIGIWFGDCHPLNISEPVQGFAANNSAEIQAARIAITVAYKAGIKKLKVFTDSDFLINCATKWISRWKENGWRLNKGGNVKNREELEKLDEVASKIDVQWVKVEGHAGIHGNEMADRLAKEGATKYKE